MAEETNTTVTETEQAENSGGDPKGGTGNAVNAVSTPEPAQAEKTFTQKELDDIVKQRLDRAKKDMPSKEELKAFREWKDSQKTAEQKAADDLAAANSAKEAAEKDKEALEIKVSCLSKGVAPQYVDDVMALAARYVDDSTTIDKAVEKVIEKYPVFSGGKDNGVQQIARGITTGARTQVISDSSGSKASFIDVMKENQVKRK